MIYSSSEYAEALYMSVRDKKDAEAKKTLVEFISSMEERGLVALLPEIMKAMPKAIKKVEGTEDVLIESAHELDEKTKNAAVSAIGRKAEEVDIQTRVNPELLGGIKVRGKDTLYDATLKNKLGRLRDSFVRG
jgi:F-type H+-transporting ATPase subunit delta